MTAELRAAVKAEEAAKEATALADLENRLKWIKPAGISVKDLWKRLGSQGDVPSLLRRLEALREDGGRAVLTHELWYHGSVTLPHIRPPVAAPEGGNVATPPPSSAKVQAANAAERREAALELLRAHPEGLKCREVAESLGLGHTTVYNYLMRLQAQQRAVCDHNGVWRIAPAPPPKPSQIDPPAPRTPEPLPPPAGGSASTVEIVAEGEVVATVEPPAPEPQAEAERPAPLSLLDELVAAGRAIEAARREIAEHTADVLIGNAFEEIAAFVGCPDYTDPSEVYRAVAAREDELTSRLAAAREEATGLRAELERIRGVLRAVLGGGS